MSNQFFQRVLSFFDQQSKSESSDKPQASNPVKNLLGPLEEARAKAFEFDDAALRDQARQSALEEEKKETLLRQAEMQADILNLHQQLKTGFSEQDLKQLIEGLHAHVAFFKDRNTDSLADQGLLAILASIRNEALVFAWNKLEAALQQAGLSWPDPLGLGPSSTAEETKQKRDLQLNQQRKFFLGLPLLRLADLMMGVIPAWRSVYPERNGPVWTETVYQAVAGAWAARRHQEVVAAAEASVEELRTKVSLRLGVELSSIQERLSKGVSSVAEARSLSDQALTVCQKVAPEVLWEVVGPQLQQARAVTPA
jgi:hypothetical protein